MLKLYETSNFRTLYDMLKINMKASSIKELENKTFDYNSNKYLSTKVIYGANAVGKSNIILSMAVLKNIVEYKGLNENSEYGNYSIYSNLIDEEKYLEPISFHIIFDNKNNEYDYSLKIKNDNAHQTSICYEKLLINEDLILERNENKLNINFDKSILKKYYNEITDDYLKKTAEIYSKDINNNSKIFNSYLQFADKICNPFNEFFDNFKAILNINDVVFKYNSFEDVKSKKIYNHLFKSIISKSDFGPQKIYYRASQENDSNLLTMTSEYALNSKESKDVAVLTIDSKYTESLGSRNLLKLTAVIFDVISRGGFLAIDEMDASINGEIIAGIINLFSDPEINKKNAQIIFTTHNPIYLTGDLFRRDEIMFLEKDKETHLSKGFTLHDLNIRNDENYLKNFINGNYMRINPIDFNEIYNDTMRDND